MYELTMLAKFTKFDDMKFWPRTRTVFGYLMLITMGSVILFLFFSFSIHFFIVQLKRDITFLSDLQTPEVIKKYPTAHHIFKCVFGNEVKQRKN